MAKDAFGVAAQAIIEQIIYAKMPPHLKKPINQAHLENGTYEQIVSHLERELELNGLEAPDGNAHIHCDATSPTAKTLTRPRPTCHHCKKSGHYQNQCPQLKREKGPMAEIIQIVPTTSMEMPKQTLTPTTRKLQTIPKETI